MKTVSLFEIAYLCGDTGSSWTNIRAGVAIRAFRGINDVNIRSLRNGSLRTFSFTSTAGDALISDFCGHIKIPFIGYFGSYGK